MAAALTPGTAAVVHVHIGGLISPDIIGLRELCDERGIALIEDAAHAHGATLDGRFAGSFGASGGLLLLSDEGGDQRRGRHAGDRVRACGGRGEDLP